MSIMHPFLRRYLIRVLPHIGFVAAYAMLDWISFIQPLYGLNITPWNPDPVLGFVYWMKYGKKAAWLWFAALWISDGIVRGFPGGLFTSLLCSVWLIAGYGVTAEILRRRFPDGQIFVNRHGLLSWLCIIVIGTLANAAGYISVLALFNLLPVNHWGMGFVRYWIGDMAGILISMPIIWMAGSRHGRMRLREIAMQWETACYVILISALLWIVFKLLGKSEFNHFYFLFLPIVWAATRQGLAGAALIAAALQLGVIAIVQSMHLVNFEIFELQLLSAVLALACFFIGVVVDEQKQLATELKQTLRLGAAGEMAAALAHELNQPMTALSAYGKTCEYLLERGETGDMLKDALQRMISEAGRAANVVRRLRDFFRTGAMQLNPIDINDIVASITQQFLQQFEEQKIAWEIKSDQPVVVNADAIQIGLVLRNLLANAVESVILQPHEKRRITLSAELFEGGRLRVSVEDSGQGISGDIAARLFEPFVSSKSSGMGLGLVLSRAIVEAHGGNLWAEVGSHGIFRFVLPLVKMRQHGNE